MSLAEGAPVPPLDPLAGGAYHVGEGDPVVRRELSCWKAVLTFVDGVRFCLLPFPDGWLLVRRQSECVESG